MNNEQLTVNTEGLSADQILQAVGDLATTEVVEQADASVQTAGSGFSSYV